MYFHPNGLVECVHVIVTPTAKELSPNGFDTPRLPLADSYRQLQPRKHHRAPRRVRRVCFTLEVLLSRRRRTKQITKRIAGLRGDTVTRPLSCCCCCCCIVVGRGPCAAERIGGARHRWQHVSQRRRRIIVVTGVPAAPEAGAERVAAVPDLRCRWLQPLRISNVYRASGIQIVADAQPRVWCPRARW